MQKKATLGILTALSSMVSTSVLGGSEKISLCSQLFERQDRGGNHVSKRVEEQRMTLATIEAERHFVQIGRQMLGADAMPRADDSALEQRERGFNRVGGDHETVFVPDVFFRAVIHGLALRYLGLGKRGRIEHGFVG